MFHDLAERKIRQMFEKLSNGDYESALHGHAANFEHSFAGDHALGGTRHTAEGLRAWFERLYRLFPNLNFEVGMTTASGPLWDTVIVAEWIDRATPATGGTYENHGVHVVRLAWGRLVSIHAYLDTQVVAETLRDMAAKGLVEAVAPPIVDPVVAVRGVARRRSSVARAAPAPRRTSAPAAARLGAFALGALATGAVAIGALAIGRLALGTLAIGQARIGRLEIDELVVRRSAGAA